VTKIIHKRILIFAMFLGIFLGVNGCSLTGASGSISFNQLPKPTTTIEMPTLTSSPTEIPPTETSSPTNTPASTLAPTPAMITIKAGDDVTVPILLYHHIADDSTGNRYFVSPATFDTQMKWLYDHHYQTITVTQLANVIIYGGQLPERAVVITFDDGNQDVITNALPIMQKYGFIGTAYIIVSWVNASGFDTSDQIAQLHADGWEIGSHTMSHLDLTKNEDNLEYEVRNSLIKLDSDYGLDVKSLAYPFGAIDSKVVTYTAKAGYTNAVGLGTSTNQGLFDLYYLSRMEVRQEYSMDQFIAMLPWQN
jgi:peptidoglycan/xylan/chitin deacetylase (PgdA/CDA1 family)